MTERIFRFVRHHEIEAYEAVGWVKLDCLDETYHGQFAALMEWRGPEREHPLCPPEAIPLSRQDAG